MQRQVDAAKANRERTCFSPSHPIPMPSTGVSPAPAKNPQRAIESARRSDAKETAGMADERCAARGRVWQHIARPSGDCLRAGRPPRPEMYSFLRPWRWREPAIPSKLGKSHNDLAHRFPLNTMINRYWLPAIDASIEIGRNNPAKALEDFQTTAQYELGTPTPQFEVGGSLYPAYIRGQATYCLHQGAEAAAEFQKFLDHRGIAVNSPLGALARLQLGRAYALQGENVKSRTAYQDFLTLWKDADPDISILKEAKAEYAKLQ